MKGMKYHDYIWDLGGTLLDNYEISTAAFVETLALYGIIQDHDSVYQALKVSTDLAIETFAPNLEHFLEKYKENEARELEHPILFEGVFVTYWKTFQIKVAVIFWSLIEIIRFWKF